MAKLKMMVYFLLNMKLAKKIFYIIYVIYLCYFSLKRVEPSSPPFPHFDKLLHFSAHAILSFLFFINWQNYKWTFIQSIAIGFAIECTQYFLPYRSFDVLDMLANTLGALVMIGIFKVLLKKFRIIGLDRRP